MEIEFTIDMMEDKENLNFNRKEDNYTDWYQGTFNFDTEQHSFNFGSKGQ